MSWQTAVSGMVLVLSISVLAACASDETRPSPDIRNDEAANAQSRQALALQIAALPNPVVIHFDKMAITLDEATKQSVPLIAERAKTARKVTITGFCDAKEIGNPSDAAVARAIALRDELVSRGVPTNSILVKFNTKVAKKHAAEVRFD